MLRDFGGAKAGTASPEPFVAFGQVLGALGITYKCSVFPEMCGVEEEENSKSQRFRRPWTKADSESTGHRRK